MDAPDRRRALAAAVSVASAAGLRVDDAAVIHDSNRIAVHLRPADVLARVAPDRDQPSAAFEVEVARHLAAAGCPIGPLDPRTEPRVHLHDSFAVTLWTYFETVSGEIAPPAYSAALSALHAGMREVTMPVPRFTERVAEAQSLIDDPTTTPDLGGAERELLAVTLRDVTASIADYDGDEQMLHGEPHPGNLLHTRQGPLFVDLGTVVRGPVEFDIAHAPDGVSEHYPGVDGALLRECRILMLALVISWRWDRDDDLPNGRQRAIDWLSEMRALLDERGLDPSS